MSDTTVVAPGSVQEGSISSGVSPQTPAIPPAGVSPQTPSTPPSDAPAAPGSAAPLDFGQERARFQADLNALRSSLDRKLAEQQREWRQREEQYQQRIRQLEMSGMDEDARAAYERETLARDYEALQRRYAEREQQVETSLRMQQWSQYFVSMGIPYTQLDLTSPEALVASGWDGVRKRMADFEARAAGQPPASPPAGQPAAGGNFPPRPPQVAAGSGSPPAAPTWEDLRRKYGDDETIYRLVETGQLDPSTVPIPPAPG